MQTATQQTDVGQESESSILRRHEKRIRWVALPFARRGVQIEDLMQEGRIALLHAAHTWTASGGATLWTYARKFILGSMLRLVTREAAEPRGDSFEGIESDAPSPEDAFAIGECSIIASRELSFLGEMERRVLRLRFVDGLDVRTIAGQLDLSKSAVDRVYQEAIVRLRERVGARI